MNILYNITPLLGKETGIGVYTRKIIEGIKATNSVDLFGFFSNSKIFDDLPKISRNDGNIDKVRPLFQIKQLVYNYAPQIVKANYAHLIEKNVSKQLQKQYKGYIYHETNYNLLPFDGKKISTFHDLSILHFPEYHPIERVKYFEKHLKYTIENADHFITDSEFVKREMIDYFGILEDRITSIPLGIDPVFRGRTLEEITPTLKKYNLLEINYFLIVGSFEPRKNLQLVFEAYIQLTEIIKQQYKIVHVGPKGWKNAKVWKQALELKSKGQFIDLGYLSKIELAHIYNGASIFIFPSLYEGFGFPPLEAMASRIPVISTSNSSLSEIVNQYNAHIIDENDAVYLKEIIINIVNEKSCSKIINAGINCKQFDWETTIKKTEKVYKKINK